MNCLLVAATAKEITPFLNEYRSTGQKSDIDVLITGVGLTSATYSLAKQLGLKRPDIVIQAGIAGCFDKNISLGSVVVIRQDTIADQSVVENKRLLTMFDLDLVSPRQFPYKNGWLVNPHTRLLKQTKLKSVNAVSVNHITTGKLMIDLYNEKFNATVESMEGAALHYVCLQEEIPFLQIRSISNYIGERNKQKWNIRDAVVNLNKEIVRITTTFKPLNP